MNILIISDNQFIKENMIRIFNNHNLNYNIVESKNINLYNVDSKYELIISAHCKKIFPPKLVNSFRCINIHPGLNPYNRGWYPQVFSIINKLPIGATIHEIDNKLDHGPIIAQEKVKIYPKDTSLDVYNRVLNTEIKLFEKNLDNILNNTYKLTHPHIEGNLNLKKDFNALCKLDLNHKGTLKEHIDLLRALTHGEFQNGYFEENNEQFFIKIDISKK